MQLIGQLMKTKKQTRIGTPKKLPEGMKRVVLRGGRYSGLVFIIEKDIDGLIVKSKNESALDKIINKVVKMDEYIYTKSSAVDFVENENSQWLSSAEVFQIDWSMMRGPVQWEFVL